MDILIVNILIGIGFVFVFVVYYFIFYGKEEVKVYFFYFILCIFIIIGFYMFNSWLVIYFNVIWGIMFLWGLKKKLLVIERVLFDLKRFGYVICGFFIFFGIVLFLYYYD